MRTIYARNPQKPWLVTYAVMSSEYHGGDNSEPVTTTRTKMVGMVRTSQPSQWGLMFGYKIRSDCWVKGYGTRAVEMFLEEYWKEPRWAPRGEVFAAPPLPSADSVTNEASPSETDEASPSRTDDASPSGTDDASPSGIDDASPSETDDASSTSTNAVLGWEGESPEAGGDGADTIIEIKHLIALIDLDNEGSTRVARKCGGKHVAVSKKSVKIWRLEKKRNMAIWKLEKPRAEPPSP